MVVKFWHGKRQWFFDFRRLYWCFSGEYDDHWACKSIYFDQEKVTGKLFTKYKVCSLPLVVIKYNYKVLHILHISIGFSIDIHARDGTGLDLKDNLTWRRQCWNFKLSVEVSI